MKPYVARMLTEIERISDNRLTARFVDPNENTLGRKGVILSREVDGQKIDYTDARDPLSWKAARLFAAGYRRGVNDTHKDCIPVFERLGKLEKERRIA